MDAALSVILPPFGFLCKAKPLLLQIGGSSLGRGKLHRIEPCPDAGSTLVAECTKAALGGNASAGDYENSHAYPLSL
jgi:hypothetical protein